MLRLSVDVVFNSKSDKMEYYKLICTQGFAHIAQQIFDYLDFRTLITARTVCKSWQTFIDNEFSFYESKKLSEVTKLSLDFTTSEITQEWTQIIKDVIQKRQRYLQCKVGYYIF